jgi:hypothetical protein
VSGFHVLTYLVADGDWLYIPFNRLKISGSLPRPSPLPGFKERVEESIERATLTEL